jgi:hypothetical protein
MHVTADHDRVAAVASAAGVGLAGILAGLVFVTVAVSLVGGLVPLVEGTPTRAASRRLPRTRCPRAGAS